MKKIEMADIRRFGKKLLLILIAAIFLFFFVIILTLPKLPADLNDIALRNPTVIFSRNGQKVVELSNRSVIPGNEIPYSFRNAILAMEDHRFNSHHGVSKKSILRAIKADILHQRRSQGGSTITQQLAKNLFFRFDKQYMRKIREAILAAQIEEQFTKEEILSAYCNQISFGQNVYGVELAAQTYFGKYARDLKIEEAALLAGLPRSPSYYNPYHNEDTAKKRQLLVLQQMVKHKYLTQGQADSLARIPLGYGHINRLWGKADYFVDEVKRYVETRFGTDALYYGGLRIYSTLDTRLQNLAIQAVRSGLDRLEAQMGLSGYEQAEAKARLKDYLQAALVAIDPRDGSVLAMVGGREYQVSPFNRATANNRQPGSAFKPFVYLTAFENQAINQSTVLVDTLKRFNLGKQIYTPRNFGNKYFGPVIPKFALTHSLNSISTQVMAQVGPPAVVATARRLGLQSELEANLSLALGTAHVSPLEMAAAYCPFSNGGIARQPRFLTAVESYSGKVLSEVTLESHRAISSPDLAYVLLDMMRGVVEEGTGSAIRRFGFSRPAAGKTGTTSDYKDAWFVGFTPDLVCAVWVGFDTPRPMYNKSGSGVTGAQAAIPIWVNFMQQALSDRRPQEFDIPPAISFETLNPFTGRPAQDGEPALEVALNRFSSKQFKSEP